MEIEYKFGLDSQAQYEALLESLDARYPGGWETVKMETDYYDTADRAISSRLWTLRVRSENGVRVLACKTPATGHGRGEWEVPEGVLPDGILALVRQGAPEELANLYHVGLHLLCGARFLRLRRLIQLPGFLVELAMDRGVLLGAERSFPSGNWKWS